MQKNVSTLLQKEMTRKEFMTTLGFGVASIMGFGSIFKLLNGSASSAGKHQPASKGYGGGAYGA